jgi:hypothetical protein
MLAVLPCATPTAIITDPTPMITPSMVRKDLILLDTILFMAIL